MRKTTTDQLKANDEDSVTEIIELTCHDIEALSRAFNMISRLCNQLQEQVDSAPLNFIDDKAIN